MCFIVNTFLERDHRSADLDGTVRERREGLLTHARTCEEEVHMRDADVLGGIGRVVEVLAFQALHAPEDLVVGIHRNFTRVPAVIEVVDGGRARIHEVCLDEDLGSRHVGVEVKKAEESLRTGSCY